MLVLNPPFQARSNDIGVAPRADDRYQLIVRQFGKKKTLFSNCFDVPENWYGPFWWCSESIADVGANQKPDLPGQKPDFSFRSAAGLEFSKGNQAKRTQKICLSSADVIYAFPGLQQALPAYKCMCKPDLGFPGWFALESR